RGSPSRVLRLARSEKIQDVPTKLPDQSPPPSVSRVSSKTRSRPGSGFGKSRKVAWKYPRRDFASRQGAHRTAQRRSEMAAAFVPASSIFADRKNGIGK